MQGMNRVNGVNRANNINFCHLKGIRYKGEFCKDTKKSICAMDAILFSDAITKDLGSKYDFIAQLEESRGRYKLSLVPDDRTDSNKKPSWVERVINFFRSKRGESYPFELTERVKKLRKKERPLLPNLPKEIQVCSESDKSMDVAFAKFIKSLKEVNIDFLNSALEGKVKKKKQIKE